MRSRVIHLAAAVAVVGGLVTVAGAGSAAALGLPPAPGSCAVYIQGPVDPTSGNLPPDLLPLKWNNQDYSVSGEVTSGDGSKIVSDLRHTGVPLTASTRFSANLKLNTTPVLQQISAATSQPLTVNSTNLKLTWKNDTATGTPTNPTVQVAESGKLNGVSAKINAVKATAAGLAAATGNQGASLGNIGPAVIGGLNSTQTLQLNIARNITSGTFKVVLNVPGVPPPAPETAAIAFNANDATIQANIQGVFNAIFGAPPGPFPSVTPTVAVTTTQAQVNSSVTLGPPISFVQGADHVIKIAITSGSNGPLFPSDPSQANPLLGRTLAYAVDHNVYATPGDPTSDVVGTTLLPADALVSNGGIWNDNQTASQIGSTNTYTGDPGVTVVADLGNNPIPAPLPGNGGPGSEDIFTANWVFSNGITGGAVPPGIPNPNPANMPASSGHNTGKANFKADSQATIAIFSKGVILGINPNPYGNISALNLALSSAFPAPLLTPSNEICSLSYLLGLFCVSDPAQIPAAFAPFCQALADPDQSSASAPLTVAGTQAVLPATGVNLTWGTPTYAVNGTDAGAALCGPTFTDPCDVIDHYEFRSSNNGTTWSPWITVPGSGPATTSAALSNTTINNPLCGAHNKTCLYQVRAQNQLAVAANTLFRPPVVPSTILIDGQAGTTQAGGIVAGVKAQ